MIKLFFSRPDTFILGEKDELTVDIRVTNNGEDAFEAAVFTPVPHGLSFKKFVALDNSSVQCWQKDMPEGPPSIVCDVGNPLPMHKGVSFAIFALMVSSHLEK